MREAGFKSLYTMIPIQYQKDRKRKCIRGCQWLGEEGLTIKECGETFGMINIFDILMLVVT